MERIPGIDYAAVVAGGEGIYGPEAETSTELSEVERILNEFEAHESGERKFTQRYREIAEKTKNPLVRFLLDLIVSDEEKHYALTHAMVATLKGSLSWTKQQDALTGLYDLAEEKEELLKITEDFIRLEKEGINEYKNLNKECSHYYHGLFALLLKAMIRDSEKHVDILEFLRERLQQR